jgi:hypothetical protein
VKFTEKQAAAWTALGENLLDIYVHITDLSLPDDVALDRGWLLRRFREARKLADRWWKTLPGIRRNSDSSARRKARGQMLLDMLPMLIADAGGNGTHASITVDGKTVSAYSNEVASDREPN